MSARTMIITLALFTAAIPFLGIPYSWRTSAMIAAGVTIAFIAYVKLVPAKDMDESYAHAGKVKMTTSDDQRVTKRSKAKEPQKQTAESSQAKNPEQKKRSKKKAKSKEEGLEYPHSHTSLDDEVGFGSKEAAQKDREKRKEDVEERMKEQRERQSAPAGKKGRPPFNIERVPSKRHVVSAEAWRKKAQEMQHT